MNKLYIVVCKAGNRPWMPAPDGVFESRFLAENYIEHRGTFMPSFRYAIVEGPITNPESLAAQEAKLGAF